MFLPIAWSNRLGKIKKLKYERCVEIEKRFEMKQHTWTQRCFPPGQLRRLALWFCWLMTLAWLARLGIAWRQVIRGWLF